MSAIIYSDWVQPHHLLVFCQNGEVFTVNTSTPNEPTKTHWSKTADNLLAVCRANADEYLLLHGDPNGISVSVWSKISRQSITRFLLSSSLSFVAPHWAVCSDDILTNVVVASGNQIHCFKRIAHSDQWHKPWSKSLTTHAAITLRFDKAAHVVAVWQDDNTTSYYLDADDGSLLTHLPGQPARCHWVNADGSAMFHCSQYEQEWHLQLRLPGQGPFEVFNTLLPTPFPTHVSASKDLRTVLMISQCRDIFWFCLDEHEVYRLDPPQAELAHLSPLEGEQFVAFDVQGQYQIFTLTPKLLDLVAPVECLAPHWPTKTINRDHLNLCHSFNNHISGDPETIPYEQLKEKNRPTTLITAHWLAQWYYALDDDDTEQELDILVSALSIAYPIYGRFKNTPLEDWIDFADTLSERVIRQQIAILDLTGAQVKHTDSALLAIYGVESPIYHQFNQQGLNVSLARIYFRQSALETFNDITEAAPRATPLMEQYYVAMDAAFECQRFEFCLELGQNAMNLQQRILCHLADDKLIAYVNVFTWQINRIISKAAKKTQQLDLALSSIQQAVAAYKTTTKFEASKGIMDHSLIVNELIAESKTLMALNRGVEAQEVLQEAATYPNLPEDCQRHLKLAMAEVQSKITGDDKHLFASGILFSNESEAEEFILIMDNAISGALCDKQRARAGSIVSSVFSDQRLAEIAQWPDSEDLVAALQKVKHYMLVTLVASAQSEDDHNKYSQLKNELRQLANSDSPYALKARGYFWAEFLALYNQGLSTACVSFTSFVKKPGVELDVDQEHWTQSTEYLADIIKANELKTFIDNASIVAKMVDCSPLQKLEGAAKVLFRFFKHLLALSTQHIHHKTPQELLIENAIQKSETESLLLTLVTLSQKLPEHKSFWLSTLAQLKRTWDFSGLRAQQQLEMFRYRQMLPPQDCDAIEQLTARLSLRLLSEKQRPTMDKAHQHLLALLLPLRNKQIKQLMPSADNQHAELLLLDTIALSTRDNTMLSASIYQLDNQWHAHIADEVLDIQSVKTYGLSLETKPGISELSAEISSIKNTGRELTEAILPKPLLEKVPLCLGVRSTSGLHGIPLESLPIPHQDGEQTSQWLAEKTVTALLTDDNQGLAHVQSRMEFESVTVIADPYYAPGIKRLPGTAAEAAGIKSTLETAGLKPTLWTDTDAHRHHFLSLDGIDAPELLHIATHGHTDHKTSTYSWLALSRCDHNNEPLTPSVGFYDISLMDLRRTKLVVLSACATHGGKHTMGESVTSLAWAFKSAGVTAVIGTRWPVSDLASVLFWQKFYDALAQGDSIAESLRQARLFLINSEQWHHPVYWAPYQLIV